MKNYNELLEIMRDTRRNLVEIQQNFATLLMNEPLFREAYEFIHAVDFENQEAIDTDAWNAANNLIGEAEYTASYLACEVIYKPKLRVPLLTEK